MWGLAPGCESECCLVLPWGWELECVRDSESPAVCESLVGLEAWCLPWCDMVG